MVKIFEGIDWYIYMVYGGLNTVVRGLIAMNYTYNLCAQDKSFSLP